MRPPTQVVVAIPARDEQDSIDRCLASVIDAVGFARKQEMVDNAAIEVSAHGCSDQTAAHARAMLRRTPTGRVVADDHSITIGAARDKAVRRGLQVLGPATADVWVVSTDADTVVPVDWLAKIISVARLERAVAVVGLALLDRWFGSESGRRAYDAVVTSKISRVGRAGWTHNHVYGANLAVRSDAYLSVGGFPDVRHGEDQQLVDTLALGGFRIARTCEIAVLTSGRMHGRADDGLADFLRGLDTSASAAPEASRVAGSAFRE
ncbi:MAG: glycosyltransferase [Nocardioidaceae bacterium]